MPKCKDRMQGFMQFKVWSMIQNKDTCTNKNMLEDIFQLVTAITRFLIVHCALIRISMSLTLRKYKECRLSKQYKDSFQSMSSQAFTMCLTFLLPYKEVCIKKSSFHSGLSPFHYCFQELLRYVLTSLTLQIRIIRCCQGHQICCVQIQIQCCIFDLGIWKIP